MLAPPDVAFPTPLDAYPPASPHGLLATLSDRVAVDPFNLVATAIFAVAILHTLGAARVTTLARFVQQRSDDRARALGLRSMPSVGAEFLHFLGEVEVVFGLWAVVLAAAIAAWAGRAAAVHYLNDQVNYTEPLFVVVIMALAASRPILVAAESSLARVARLGGDTAAAWWVTILFVGPLLGSFITEPAAMTICALLLARRFFDLEPSRRLKYATLGLLFVNVSIGGALTHFAAPPVLMVARPWGWDARFMFAEFGWRAIVAVAASTAVYFAIFRRELTTDLARRPPAPDVEEPEPDATAYRASATLLQPPIWVTAVHFLFLAWTVVNAHYPALFVGGFLFFLGFVKATAPYQGRVDLRAPLLVGLFLAGLVVHGGLQGWWIAPAIASLSETPLFLGAVALTGLNDNALITYLATLVPSLTDPLKVAVVGGALAGGGLTVIANAPNPAGQALLAHFFGGAVLPLGLLIGALLPTIIAMAALRLL